MVDTILHVLSELIAREIKNMLCVFMERGHLEAYPSSPQDVAPCAFPLVDPTLYLFTVINHGCECDSMLRPVSPPTKIIPPGDGLKGPSQHSLV